MTEERFGKLEIPLVVLEDDIKLHLNSAQASLDAQQVKYARNGLLSAAIVSATAKLALTHADFADAKEHARFQQYMEMAVKLINAYWEDFGLTLLKSAQTGETVERRVQPKPENGNGNGHPIVKTNGRGRKPAQRMDPKDRKEMLEMLAAGTPDNYETTADWLPDVAVTYHTNMNNVQNAYYSMGNRAKAKNNSH